ncbi:divergent polysaccharide deacetylase family protein [Temperatibacter marinus]|uniref:Divergent polysaccharide deacetylase family protein n=1 Tax=Temperatibacter marinus TaxID=1456591 RepID=A0AA52EHE8_9PROT|nr:divergent polysaccharide deacetylase family protein [Temperatibacter marinus]WND02369.1 divergent polysaccharide deacetylase family protein [Temperatibacter marinus]
MKRYLIIGYVSLILALAVFLAYHLMEGQTTSSKPTEKATEKATEITSGKNDFVSLKETPRELSQETRDILNAMKPVVIPLPAIKKNSKLAKPLPAWQDNASVLQPKTQKPKLVIVIDDLGLKTEATYRLATMQGPFTLAYLPYALDLPYQTGLVKDAGHELMVHLPMEPQNQDVDPGTNALLTTLDQAELKRRLDWNLTRFEGYVGVNNHMGSHYTADGPKMALVMAKLKKEGYLFLDSLTTNKTFGPALAKELDVPFIARDIFLDNVRTRAAIEKQLTQAAKIAMSRGYAIAIGHPYDETLDVLEDLAARRDRLPYELAPLSAVILSKSKND